MPSFLVVGLGNPGQEYENTRHNLGIRAVHSWAERNGARTWQHKKEYGAEVARVKLADGQFVVCLFPLTKMNRSGEAVRAYLDRNPVEGPWILIVHDDLELPLGSFVFKEGGSAAGHKGVRSIHQALGTQAMARLRVGIGRPTDDQPVEEYVLKHFSAAEEAIITEKFPEITAAITAYLKKTL